MKTTLGKLLVLIAIFIMCAVLAKTCLIMTHALHPNLYQG